MRSHQCSCRSDCERRARAMRTASAPLRWRARSADPESGGWLPEVDRTSSRVSFTPPVIRLFTEARLHRHMLGGVKAVDPGSAAAAWDPYVDRLEAAELAARVGPPNQAAGHDIGRIAIYPLPFYSGPRQLILRLPTILRAIGAATQGVPLCVFRLPGTVSLVGAAWCRLRRRRYVVEVIGDPAGVLKSGVLGPVGCFVAPAGAWLMRWVVGGARAGRYVTEAALQSAYPLARGAAEYRYSNVTLTTDDFTPGPRKRSRRIRRLIAVGTHDQLYKGHDDLIRALAVLVARGFDLQLGLAGDGRYHNELQRLARDCGVEDRVAFHGRVNSRADLRHLLDEADLFCMPSRTEGLPRALIEAMARGVPAIGTTVGGIPELINPEFCIRPGDPEALAALIESFANGAVDPELVSSVVWHRAQRFAPHQQARRINQWLDEIAGLARAAS